MPDSDNMRARSLVFPILVILVGGLFLYRNFVPSFEPWPVIWKFWPLLLILVGLGHMFDAIQASKGSPRRGISIGSTVGVLLFVLVIVMLMWRGHAFTSNRAVDHVSEARELGGADSLHASITMPEGQLNLSGGTGRALDAEFDYKAGWSRPRVDYHVSDKKGVLEVSQENRGPALGPEDNTWHVRLNDSVPVDLEVAMGAAQGNLDLREVNLKELVVKAGVGQVKVDLTGKRSADVSAGIHGGVGQAVVRLPKNIGVIVEAHGGIGAVTTHGLKKDGDMYINDAYKKSPHTLTVNVDGGIGNIDLTVEP
jgi:uncharacterized protein DUF2154/cell wall-active antibiotic response 4TMS protein YvqF